MNVRHKISQDMTDKTGKDNEFIILFLFQLLEFTERYLL